MTKLEKGAVLVVIDAQKAWLEPEIGKRNNPYAEKVINKLIVTFRNRRLRIIHVRHESSNPASLFREGKPTFEFIEEAEPASNELVITKHVNSAFIGTNLESILRKMKDPQVFYVGFVTDHCVSTTARMSGNLGFRSHVIEDGCATFDRVDPEGNRIAAGLVHKVNLASINEEFAKVISSKDIL